MSAERADAAVASRPYAIALAVLLLVAAALRTFDLASVGFWGPEDYVVLAARGIPEHGVPRLPTGAVYPRAIPYTYLVAGSVALLGENEFAVRLPGALLSTAAVAIGWALARLAFGSGAALLAALALALCDWEIAMGRTARMYGPYSCAGLLLVWLAARRMAFGSAVRVRGVAAAAALAASLHQIALTLAAPLALLPVLRARRPREWLLLAVPALVLLLGSVIAGHYIDSQYVRMAEHAAALDGQAAPAAAPHDDDGEAPQAAGAGSAPAGHFALAAALAGLGGALAARALAGPAPWLALASGLAVAALALGRPLLAAYVWAALAVAARWWPGVAGPRALAWLGAVIAVSGLGWVAWWLTDGATLTDAVREAALRPRNFLQLHLLRAPAVFALAALAGWRLLRAPRDEARTGVGLLVLAAWVVPATVMGLHPQAATGFHDRYAYAPHAFALILYAGGAWWLASVLAARLVPDAQRSGATVLLALAVMAASGGLDVRASAAAANPQPGADPILSSSRGEPFFFADHRGTARFVCAHAGERDRVVVTDALAHAVYCDRLDYQFTMRGERNADRWLLGARNRDDATALLVALDAQPGERVWFVVSQEELWRRSRADASDPLESILSADCVRRAYLSRDGVSAVHVWDRACQARLRAVLAAAR